MIAHWGPNDDDDCSWSYTSGSTSTSPTYCSGHCGSCSWNCPTNNFPYGPTRRRRPQTKKFTTNYSDDVREQKPLVLVPTSKTVRGTRPPPFKNVIQLSSETVARGTARTPTHVPRAWLLRKHMRK